MYKPFVYGTSVSGENFTDRVNETTRIKKNFSSGINTILISPRRLGKTSLVKKVISELDGKDPVIVFMDIYDCRSAHDFYLRYSQSILKALSSTAERLMENAKEFLGRLAPRISINPDLTSEYSLSIGVTPKDIDPEEILNLPERIAEKKGLHIVVCIDEFQQIGEFSDSLTFQKRLRGVWQHQQRTSYCLFGSKKHMMEKIFHSKGCRSICSETPFTSEQSRRLTGCHIYAPDSIKQASPFQKDTLRIFAAELIVILRMFSNLRGMLWSMPIL